MAHAVQPNHRPHEQLRMEPPSQRQQTDKYVSAFVTGSATVDMSFRNPVLPKSADHFKVGIDELTVNLGNLSMLSYDEGNPDVLFRVLRRGRNDVVETHETFQMFDAPAPYPGKWRDGFEFKINRPYITILEILDRCMEVAIAVNTFIREVGLVQPGAGADPVWTTVYPVGQPFDHFLINITTNGQLRFSGSPLFWANFTIEVPVQKYRQIIFRDVDQKYVSLHPGTGNEIARPYEPTAGGGGYDNVVINPVWDGQLDNPPVIGQSFVADGNLLNTLDRRVTLEVGCSLPVKNSPLVDHGQEAPDFVLGRYMFHQPYSMQGAANITVPHLGTITVQGPRDRVVYHHLQPQQKIQVLRLKLWARVRTYDNATRKWGMKTIVCPVEDIDYWHIRMHFLEK